MMEISVGDRGEVYVLRGGRLPYQVLNPDGTVEEVFVDRGSMLVYEDGDEHEDDYEEGFQDGYEEALDDARSALDSVFVPSSPRRRTRPRETPTAPAVKTVAATGGRL